MSSVEPLDSVNWTRNEPLKIRPFKPKYHITMGKIEVHLSVNRSKYHAETSRIALQNSSPAELIVMDRNYHDRVLERRGLIADLPATVVGAIPQGKAAVDELYSYLITQYLPHRFPTMFSIEQDGKLFKNMITGVTSPTVPPEDPVAALKILGETIEDDIFLLHETSDGHRSVAYVCCYCSGFDPSEKLDKLLVEIHEPVPSYHKIGPSMERFFSRVEVGKNVKRVNVSHCVLGPATI